MLRQIGIKLLERNMKLGQNIYSLVNINYIIKEKCDSASNQRLKQNGTCVKYYRHTTTTRSRMSKIAAIALHNLFFKHFYH